MYRQIVQQFARAAHFPILRYSLDHFALDGRMIAELKDLDYLNQWRTIRSREWFHIEMEDLSFFTFWEGGGKCSYSYVACPLDIPSYRDYLSGIGLEFTVQNRRERQDDYEMLLETADLRKHITPIRYDLDPLGYRPGVHPLAHMHVGLQNNVRLGISKKLTPLAFVFFVMRQSYPDSWERLLKHAEAVNADRKIRAECPDVDAAMWLPHDRVEYHLT